MGLIPLMSLYFFYLKVLASGFVFHAVLIPMGDSTSSAVGLHIRNFSILIFCYEYVMIELNVFFLFKSDVFYDHQFSWDLIGHSYIVLISI